MTETSQGALAILRQADAAFRAAPEGSEEQREAENNLLEAAGNFVQIFNECDKMGAVNLEYRGQKIVMYRARNDEGKIVKYYGRHWSGYWMDAKTPEKFEEKFHRFVDAFDYANRDELNAD